MMKSPGKSRVLACATALAALVLALPGLVLGQAYRARPIKTDVGRIAQSKEFAELQQKQGVEPYYLGSADFTAFLGVEIAKWAKLVRDSGAKVD